MQRVIDSIDHVEHRSAHREFVAESALAIPARGFGGIEAYPELAQKAGLTGSVSFVLGLFLD